MKKPVQSIVGDWRIVEMEQWDREYMDMEVRAFIRFRKDGSGEFQFGLVSGSLDCRSTLRQGKPAVEFTWEGQDEMDPASGRGWAMLEQGKVLKGRILFHGGDESGFVAKNQGEKSSRGKRPARD
jgi:hypothetical protein